MRAFHKTFIIAVALVAAACTWVKPIDGAGEVLLLDAVAAESCTRLGTTNVSVKHKVGFVNRGAPKVRKELRTLAQNAAIDKGGNAVVEDSAIEDGRQQFSIYRCAE